MRRKIFKILGIAIVVFLVAFAALALYVYKQSISRFEVRRLSLPTRVYADYLPLQAGMPLDPDDLLEKLDRLGYRSAPTLAQAGDYVAAKGSIDIFTREFAHPTGKYPSQHVHLTFSREGIESVSAGNAALEPELLTSILSEQLENRRPITLNQVPQSLQDAVVVTEDTRFWHHPGVDPIGIFRAFFRNVRAGGVSEGGSTLTQQLVKNYYLTPERSMRRKVTEAFMAVILDAKYSKKEILEAYLNDIYLGRNRSISIIGVGEAAHFYFGKPVSELNPAESAMLAGMIKSPNNYSPFVHPDQALLHRNTSLGLMLKAKKIDQATYEKSVKSPLPRKPFRQRSGLSSMPYYVDRVLQEMARDYGIKDVKGRGLQIYTAIDLNAQDTAARTLENGLESLERNNRRLRRAATPLQGVIINVDVQTGEIRSLVGGRNYDINQFDRALNAKRQIGSLVKPFVYLTAFEPSLSGKTITPATLVSDQRFVLKRRFAADWSPRNYEDVYHGTVTVREALEESMNSASVRIGLATGIPNVIRTMKTLGITSDIDDNPAMLLGTADISPIEMADAYTTIARVGSRVPLRTIRFVTDDRGRLVAGGEEVKAVQVYPARDTFVLVNIMKGVVDRGTAAGVRSLGFHNVAAGKTGTTNDKRDAWFIGFTPKSLTLTWLGFDDNTPVGLSGGQGAAPMWARYMEAVSGKARDADWAPPPGITTAETDETSGGLATPYCPKNTIVQDAFKEGTQPTVPCPLHSPAAVPPPALDQFGNPIALDTTGATTTDTTATQYAPPPTAPPPPSTETTLTGGIFKTDTTGTSTMTPTTPTQTDTTRTDTQAPPG
ncbi:MAG TPA: PBP1A family penicillin-binding protein [Thermoanaerobaculia bacterium]|nr:PBP1A family penicillin-binding protein [Thermoanaerobaculia bacterium]